MLTLSALIAASLMSAVILQKRAGFWFSHFGFALTVCVISQRFQVKKKSLVEHLNARIYLPNSFVSFVLREFECLNISMTRLVTVHNITATDHRD